MATDKGTKPKSKTLDDIIAKATPVERTVYVCVAGALAGEAERVRDEMESLQSNPVTQARLSTGDKSVELLAELDRIHAEMAEATFPFRFRAVSPKRWSDLISAHADPQTGGVDMASFGVAAIAATCYEPEGMDDEESLSRLLDNLSPAQQAELVDAAWEVNTTAPKGVTSSVASETQPS